MDRKQFKYTVITTSVTLGSILTHIIHSIFGFIAIYFFKPLWDKIVRWYKNEG